MGSKLGFQVYPTEAAARFLDRVGRAAAVKILDPILDAGRARWIAAWAREWNIPLIFRFVGFFDHRSPHQDPATHLDELWRNFFSIWPRDLFPDYLELFNEGDSTPEGVAAHHRYYVGPDGRSGALKILREWGIKGLLFNFATGTPPEGVHVPFIPGAAYGAHEYAWGRPGGGFDLHVPYHVGRYMAWIPDVAPEIFITETGVEAGGHRAFGIPPVRVIEALDRFYARDARVKAFIWFLVGSPFGWAGYDLVGQEEEIRAYLAENPPEAGRQKGGSMIYGIDCSAYSGPIYADAARRLVERYRIGAAVVQAWGGGPAGTGPNRWALHQLQAFHEAGCRLAVYVWPPRAVSEAMPMLLAIRRAFPIRFVALDVEGNGGQVSREHVDILVRNGFRPVIYSSPGMWSSLMRNTTSFSDIPYWEAHYTRKFRNLTGQWNGRWPTEEDRPWDPATKGGWTFSPGWQFIGSTRLDGFVVDLNVFHPSIFGE